MAIPLALAVMPREYDSLILGSSKTLHDKYNIDEMTPLKDTAAASGGGESSTELAPAEVPVIPFEIFSVRRVAITMGIMHQVADIEVGAFGETDRFKDALLER